ncbi:glycoside hydrolase family 2 TIM barrel-domain containing protein [Kribbella sp. NPDC006257]|uniref:glycoside hydrolase family 2 TIM barrel-domain containing protein n=1 Tax=Kribbella sp. NPDC006257 TaxID=3156738 RepID=UPI0033B8A860
MTLQRRHFLALGAAGAAAATLSRPDSAAAAGLASTEIRYLTGADRDTPVDWDFMVSSGRRSGVWSSIPTPSQWECEGFGTYRWGWNLAPEEIGHYRHSFTVPGSWKDRRTYLVFEGSMTDTEVWLNGESAGPKHQGGFYRFRYDVTGKLLPGASNLLEVTVARESADESINRAERMGDYWNFSGIYRPVYLQSEPMEAVDRLAVDARADGSFAVDTYLTGVTTADRVIAQIRRLDGTPVGSRFSASIDGQEKVTVRTTIDRPDLWSAETPNLYQVEVTLASKADWLHTTSARFGFRTIEVRAGDGVYVNGAKIVFKGVCRHTSWPTSGRTSSKKLTRDDISLIKEMNMNAVRMSHYPPDTHFLDRCDEVGLYVLDELGGWQKKYDEGVAAPLVKSMVTRDVNHPSIVFWDNGNEGGWNTALDDDFALYDPQQRKVLHPWANFSDINTDHYETYDSTRRILEGTTIFMPTEYLHGLYDGGHGAGLDDYWKLLGERPLSAGGFLWSFADEGVVREDLDGRMDVNGNQAPDGIIGPFREKEASFFTIKDIWSPIQTTLPPELPTDFTGDLPIVNRYAFTNTSDCRFEWSLIDYAGPADRRTGHTVRVAGAAKRLDLAAGHAGVLPLRLPSNWRRHDALAVAVTDPTGRQIARWVWPTKSAADHARALVRPGRGSVDAVATEDGITLRAGKTGVTIDAHTARLTGVTYGGLPISLSNGPAPATGTAALRSLSHGAEGRAYVVRAEYDGGLASVQWRLQPSGWLQLDYSYDLTGSHDYFGVNFDYPQAKVEGVKWLGRGPYRVWQNRMRGVVTDVWAKDFNDTATGAEGWTYPEFKGYHADLHWAVLRTVEGPITVVTEDNGLFLRLFTPKNGVDPRNTAVPFPAGDLSFLDAIPAIGTKFDPAVALGPQSQPAVATGPYHHTLHFKFGR